MSYCAAKLFLVHAVQWVASKLPEEIALSDMAFTGLLQVGRQ